MGLVGVLTGCASDGSVADGEPAVGENKPTLQTVAREDDFEAEPPFEDGTVDKAGCNNRNDYSFSNERNVSAGFWGSWGSCTDLCPINSFVYGFEYLQDYQGGNYDDSAVNTISMKCYDRTTGQYTGYVASKAGWWGSWNGWYVSGSISDPVTGGWTLTLPQQGGGDDWSMADVQLTTLWGSTLYNSNPQLISGNWANNSCPSGTAVCGLNTRLESKQGTSADDTALNGLTLACCTF